MTPHEEWFAPGGGAGAVRGMMTPASAQVLSALLSDQLERDSSGSLVEIGVFCGKTLLGLALASKPGERVLGVDVFPEHIKTEFLSNLANLPDEQARKRVTAVRRDTLSLDAKTWIDLLDRPARFVHIDGGHNRPCILNDLHLASCHVAKDAVVVLDDVFHDWYPDLTEGVVDGLRASKNIVPVALVPRSGPIAHGGSKLVCATVASADHYRRLLHGRFADRTPGVRTFVGHPVVTFKTFD